MPDCLLVCCSIAYLGAGGTAAAQGLSTQTSSASGLTVSATPRALSGGAWKFEIVFDNYTQELNDDSVTIAMTPQILTGTAANWDFKIVLDAHSADLSDDLTITAALVDGGGRRYKSATWEGAGPGSGRNGNHRQRENRDKRE